MSMYQVVLVDDEQIILNGLVRAFPWEDYNCRVAGTAMDGREGLEVVRKLRPQILLTDIRMPNMDGLSMVAALKSEFPQLQIIVLTAFRDFDYAQQALHLGVCRYLLKPSNMAQLREALDTVVKNLTPETEKAAGQEMLDEESPAGEENEAGAFVARAAVKYIQEHCTEHLSLSDVAEHVYVSQWHLSKLINRCCKRSFFDIVNELRVEKAKAMLADPSLKVNEIAFEVGYTDVAHFSRNFKKITGQTPMGYRGSLR